MEHRLRRKQLNSDTKTSKKIFERNTRKKERRNFFFGKNVKKKMKNMKKSKNEEMNKKRKNEKNKKERKKDKKREKQNVGKNEKEGPNG